MHLCFCHLDVHWLVMKILCTAPTMPAWVKISYQSKHGGWIGWWMPEFCQPNNHWCTALSHTALHYLKYAAVQCGIPCILSIALWCIASSVRGSVLECGRMGVSFSLNSHSASSFRAPCPTLFSSWWEEVYYYMQRLLFCVHLPVAISWNTMQENIQLLLAVSSPPEFSLDYGRVSGNTLFFFFKTLRQLYQYVLIFGFAVQVLWRLKPNSTL